MLVGAKFWATGLGFEILFVSRCMFAIGLELKCAAIGGAGSVDKSRNGCADE